MQINNYFDVFISIPLQVYASVWDRRGQVIGAIAMSAEAIKTVAERTHKTANASLRQEHRVTILQNCMRRGRSASFMHWKDLDHLYQQNKLWPLRVATFLADCRQKASPIQTVTSTLLPASVCCDNLKGVGEMFWRLAGKDVGEEAETGGG